MKSEATFQLPVGASTVSAEIDQIYYGIYALSVFFFLGIVGAMLYFMWKYRRKAPNELPSGPTHSTLVEVTWTVLPTIIVIIIFAVSFKAYMRLVVAPGDAMEINVTGQKWSWSFQYPNGIQTSNEMVVPKGKPVKLIMTSQDVIHSFFIPAFRVKHDVVPGQYSSLWFEATEVGDYDVYCTEYCGTAHSDMLARVKVLEPAAYDKWLEENADPSKGLTPQQFGEKLYAAKACMTCHSLDGSPKVGPTWKGIWGREAKLANGTTVQTDENYLRESILEPNAKVVAGFPPVMPTYKGQINEKELLALIAYMKTLK